MNDRADLSATEQHALLPQLLPLFEAQQAAFRHAPFPAWHERAAHLHALRAMLRDNRAAIAAAINADFGNRCVREVEITEIFILLQEIRAALRHGKRWMKSERRSAGKWMLPARAKVVPQPLGVIGIVAPWNYPILLAASPLVSALAAGNRALIKMSEFTPRTAALFAQLIAGTFAPDHVGVVTGDADLGAAFTTLPFDHLLFTGSTKVGHAVMRAAARNLTPVTLELGGKSPAIIGPNARFDYAVDSIMLGKTLNAGQTCVAPDYVLVPRGTEQAFVERARHAMAKHYPNLAQNLDYTTIVSPRHFARLEYLADAALAAGAQAHPLTDAQPNPTTRQFPPVVFTAVSDATPLMQEEIFGPLLPVLPYDSLDTAIAWVNARPRPLALYLYDENQASIERVMAGTVSGAFSVNENLLHVGIDALPFGGVGPSGMGAYHGIEGFRTMSRMKPVLIQARFNARKLIAPPYGAITAALVKLMMRF
jgi:coniferyl-aldehyde dehydrogenase